MKRKKKEKECFCFVPKMEKNPKREEREKRIHQTTKM
jgi:hypothetical protein